MSERQKFLDKVRELKKELQDELVKPRHFVKEVEPFMIKEAIVNLEITETHLHGYLQVDKFKGN